MTFSENKFVRFILTHLKPFLLSALGIINLYVLDQFTKILAIKNLKDSAPVEVIQGLLNFAYVENRGAAWGMLQGHVWPLAFFAIVATIFIIWKSKVIFGISKSGKLMKIVLLAGIFGNLTDRIQYGYVVDFIDFHWMNLWHFPCFNFADIYISLVALFLIITSIFSKEAKKKENKDCTAK